jgi:hypothetical protein
VSSGRIRLAGRGARVALVAIGLGDPVLANILYPGIKASCGKIVFMDVVVSMLDLVARQWGDTPQAIGRHVIEDAVIERYRAGRLSHRQVGDALGLD